MTRKEFEALISRYLCGKATEAEERLIEDFFAAQEERQSPDTPVPSEAMWAYVKGRVQSQDEDSRKILNGRRQKGNVVRRLWIPVSLMFIAALTFTVVFHGGPDFRTTTPPWITLHTPDGQKSIITLADGTTVFLNAGSTITYPEVFDPEKRQVKLTGEAFFEVAENPKQPFIVDAGEVTTRVLGTSFNVQAFPDRQISVTVATGKVQVQTAAHRKSPSDSAQVKEVILMANSQAIYTRDGVGFTVAEVDIEKYIGWKDNTLLFDGASIEEVARILERWYDVTIVFDNTRIKDCRISGKYKEQSLENVLKSIQYMYHVDYWFSGQNTVHLGGNGCNLKPSNNF